MSILSPGVEPAFPRAEVVWIGDPEPRASRTNCFDAGEVIDHEPVLVRRYYATPIGCHVGRDYIVNQPDGSQVIYSGPEGYREALRDGTLGVR